jgi:hypothetical protein
LAGYLARTSPDVAYWLRASPTALLNLADDKLNADAATQVVEPVLSSNYEPASRESSYAKGIQSIEKLDALTEAATSSGTDAPSEPSGESGASNLTDADYRQIDAWAKQALRHDPLNARALRILAQLAEHAADDNRTEALMRAAADRSSQESLAFYWMMRQSYRHQDYAEAIRYADMLLRTRPRLSKHVFPMLGRMAEKAGANVELTRVLATDPPWRLQFFGELPNNVTDARTPLELLLSLHNTPSPPTDAETKSYLQALVKHGLYELAYYSWLQFLSPEQLTKTGRLFNGGFELTPSGLPFDWVFENGSGVNIKFPERPDTKSGRALLIEFGPGRVNFARGISELVLLPPGTYRLQGEYKADLTSERGLQWSVICAGATNPVGVGPTMNGSDPSWRSIDFSFTIPAAECPAQYITLALDARSTSEQFVSGAVWYDDLSLTLLPDAAQSAE